MRLKTPRQCRATPLGRRPKTTNGRTTKNARTIRGTFVTVVAAGALTFVAPAAQAGSVDRFDRSAFDSTPVVTAPGYEMEGATSGELGGYLSLSVQQPTAPCPAPASAPASTGWAKFCFVSSERPGGSISPLPAHLAP